MKNGFRRERVLEERKQCPFCFEESFWREIITRIWVNVGESRYFVRIRYYVCLDCNERFRCLFDDIDPVSEALKKHKERLCVV